MKFPFQHSASPRESLVPALLTSLPAYRGLLFVFLALTLGACAATTPAPEPPPASPPLSTLRVASFNIRFNNPDDGPDAWPHRRRQVASLLEYHDADLYGLQEVLVGQLEDLLALLPAYGVVGVARNDGRSDGEFSPILYRRDRFDLLDQGTFWLSETPADTGSVGWDAALPRIVTWAHLRDSTGVAFYHYNTHFDHRGEGARKESARLIARRIDAQAGDSPVVLTGDFNVTDASDAYAILTQHDRRPADRSAEALTDARSAARFVSGPPGTYSGFALDLSPGRRIDYIFVKNGVRPLYFGTLVDHWQGRFPSDHRPVLADLVLPTAP